MKEKFKPIALDGRIKINLGERGYWDADKRELCRAIIDICEEYQDNGDTLTLRQMYYQLVSKDAVPNHDKVYKKISSIKDELVYGGLVDWSVFEDRGRVPIDAYYEHSVEDALQRTINQYKLYRQEGQSNVVEVWTEKDAISGILRKVTLPYGVKLVVNKGYTSSTAVYGAYKRFMQEFGNGNRVTILYFGDHDPSGIDMIRDIRERLTLMFTDGERVKEWGMDRVIDAWFLDEDGYVKDWINDKYNNEDDHEESNFIDQWEDGWDLNRDKIFFNEFFQVIPIGLTKEQIRLYNPPPNPAKITDPRAKGYIKEHGRTSWEVDALRPDLMREIVEDAIKEQIDVDVFNAVLETEKEDKAKITKMIKSIG